MKKAYHFLKDDMTGGYGREPAWKIGEKRTVKGELVMCSWGYHASPNWYDALGYAQGNMACIVELSGEIKKDTDKYVARTRKLIDAHNAEKVLRTWVCDCVERALKRAKITDEGSWNAIKVARLFNEGKATKKELDAAGDIAWAAWATARTAAWDIAWAAWATAWDATKDAAWATARTAAWDAETKWQKAHLNKLMNKLFKGELK